MRDGDLDNSWPAYRHMVLSALDRLDDRDKRFDEKLEKIIRTQEKILIDVSGLDIKSRIWGMLGGLIPVLVALALLILGRVWQ